MGCPLRNPSLFTLKLLIVLKSRINNNNNNNNNLFLTHNNTIKVLKCGVQTIKYTQKKQNIQKMKSNDSRNFLR